MLPILEIKNISKIFRISHENRPYLSFRDAISNLFTNANSQNKSETFYALKNISLDVFPGESIGIIGKNGAGKSTLLKILSKITPPSSGNIISRGRIASLLEVGTGFHPELTGKENIFLNGSILGMKRQEIHRKLDEIIDFSGVENFLDTPLKHYSSGMQLRLAFAVAAFLEPEILIIDEVLAVGDAEFQKKCLGKMQDISKNQGRTLLFVSHNLSSITQLCTKGIVLSKGEVSFSGSSYAAVEHYSQSSQQKDISTIYLKKNIEGKDIETIKASVTDALGKSRTTFEITEEIILNITIKCLKKIPGTYAYVVVKNRQEDLIIESDTYDNLPNCFDEIQIGENNFTFRIKPNILAHGDYLVYLSISSPLANSFMVDDPGDILSFTVEDNKTKRGARRTAKTSYLLKWEKS